MLLCPQSSAVCQLRDLTSVDQAVFGGQRHDIFYVCDVSLVLEQAKLFGYISIETRLSQRKKGTRLGLIFDLYKRLIG